MYDLSDPKSFEHAVAILLRLAGYDVVQETLIGHKRVDLYFEERRFGKVQRTAVECKSSAYPLSQHDLTEIYADYLPLYEANLIDGILVVTNAGLAPSAQARIRESRELSHLTYAQLEITLMDFQSYLNGLVRQYSEDGLDSYYVPLSTTRGEDLEQIIDNYIRGESDRPIAVLASYGMGKTTFARHMAHLLAQRAIGDPSARVPILLQLGEISSEQSLEGLLGKALTSKARVHGYSFEVFMALNETGRFVILLDGFDEMKHLLSWDQFRFNFRQLNRLVSPHSRVILLGRPTAFLSDYEHNYALHGIRTLRDQQMKESDWPDYQEVYIAHFSRDQVDDFLKRYLQYKRRILGHADTRDSRQTQQRIDRLLRSSLDRVSSKHLADIARRPVQLYMLAEVLPQWKGDIDDITVSILYDVFIDKMIDRELEKVARKAFGLRDRRRFVTDIAWWLWTVKKEMCLSAEEIPEYILKAYAKQSVDLEAIRRDLVSACFLERKLGETLYFPHRSFQEFLVGCKLREDIASEMISFADANSAVTDEVAAFIAGSMGEGDLDRWLRKLATYQGLLSWKLANVCVAEDGFIKDISNAASHSWSPWNILLLGIGIRRERASWISPESFCELILNKLKKLAHDFGRLDLYSGDPAEEAYGGATFALVCYLMLVGMAYKGENDRGRRLSSRIIADALSQLCRIGRGRTHVGAHSELGSEWTPLHPIVQFLSTVRIGLRKASHPAEGRLVDLGGTYPYLAHFLRGRCLISEWVVGSTLRTESLWLPTKIYTWGLDTFDEVEAYQGTYCK